MVKNTGENTSKNLIGKYSQKLLDEVKGPVTDAFKTAWKREIRKSAESTGNLIANRITKVSKHSQQNNLETVKNEYDNEITEER